MPIKVRWQDRKGDRHSKQAVRRTDGDWAFGKKACRNSKIGMRRARGEGGERGRGGEDGSRSIQAIQSCLVTWSAGWERLC